MARSEITTTPLMRWPSFSLFSSSYHCRTDALAPLNYKHSHTPSAQSIKKGTAYMNIVMYAIHELESAIDKCPNDRDASGHAWDEGCAPLLSCRCCCAVVVVPLLSCRCCRAVVVVPLLLWRACVWAGASATGLLLWRASVPPCSRTAPKPLLIR